MGLSFVYRSTRAFLLGKKLEKRRLLSIWRGLPSFGVHEPKELSFRLEKAQCPCHLQYNLHTREPCLVFAQKTICSKQIHSCFRESDGNCTRIFSLMQRMKDQL